VPLPRPAPALPRRWLTRHARTRRRRLSSRAWSCTT
jgi:hypothetical protein